MRFLWDASLKVERCRGACALGKASPRSDGDKRRKSFLDPSVRVVRGPLKGGLAPSTLWTTPGTPVGKI